MPVFTANRMNEGLTLPAYANPQDPAEFILVWLARASRSPRPS
jgi:hypothetical protein